MTLDEYIKLNHKELAEDIEAHISLYVEEYSSCKGLYRCIMASIRQHETNGTGNTDE